MEKILAVAIFVVMFALIIWDRFPRQWVTLGSGALVLVLVFGLCMHDGGAIWETLNLSCFIQKGFWVGSSESNTGINWSTIVFIAGMMVMVEGMGHAGIFQWLCLKIAKLVHYRTVPLLICFMVMSALLAMFIDSITVILFLAAVTAELAKTLYFDPVPMILAEIFCANLGGSATMCGDPPNIIIGTSLGLSFFDFLGNTGVIAAVCLVFTVVYFWLRGAISFEKSMESVPQGFIQMIAPILILTFAWTLCSFTRFGMYSAVFVKNAMAGAGDLKVFLPAVIFLIGCAIGFATGTSWGTIGIMAPIVVSVFNYDVEPVLCTIGLAAACSGGVMGDHCSPISDTTIMASAGAHCFHLNHVFTQLPYALTASGVAFVSFIIAGLVQSVWLCLAIAVALMIGTLLVIRAIVSRRHAGIFQEMAQASQQLLHR